MSDIAEDFAAMRERSMVKRSRNRDWSAQALKDAGVEFESKNNGAHLIISATWDFWPGTGLYRHRSLPVTGRGVRNLLREVSRISEASPPRG